jgi:hypothetical protein
MSTQKSEADTAPAELMKLKDETKSPAINRSIPK